MSDAANNHEQPINYAVRITERAQRDIDLATVHFADMLRHAP
jgi:hypothetical protein